MHTLIPKTLLLTLLTTGTFGTLHAQPVPHATPEYTALQLMDTVPGPFINQIYISKDKERQDATLGGKTVTTIIRHDKGVAWLLIPNKKHYQEIDIQAAPQVSVQALLSSGQKTTIGQETVDHLPTTKYALHVANDPQPTLAWVTDNGIVLKAEIPANEQLGRPKASIRLQELHISPQSPALFELPAGYTKVD